MVTKPLLIFFLRKNINNLLGDASDRKIQMILICNVLKGCDIVCSDIAPRTIGNKLIEHINIIFPEKRIYLIQIAMFILEI